MYSKFYCGCFVRFQVLTAANVKFRVFWAVAPCSYMKWTDVSEVRTASIIRAIIAAVVVVVVVVVVVGLVVVVVVEAAAMVAVVVAVVVVVVVVVVVIVVYLTALFIK
jgi:hypothetical protein